MGRWGAIAIGSGVAFVLGCGGGPAPPPPEPDEPQPVEEPAGPGRGVLPEDPFAEVDGLVGVVVEPEAAEGRWWIPREGGTILVPGTAFATVGAGGAFTALHPDGPIPIVFEGVRDVPWGCGTAKAGVFSAAATPGPGLVWVVAEPSELRAASATVRRQESSWLLYRLPKGAELDVKPGRSVIEMVGSRPWVHAWRGQGVDLSREDQPGPHRPDLVLLEGDVMMVLLRSYTDRGFGWDLLRIAEKKGTILGRQESGVLCPQPE